MAEQPTELNRLADIANDLKLPVRLRNDALEELGKIGTHEALLVLLSIAGNDHLIRNERDIALKQARKIVKSGH